MASIIVLILVLILIFLILISSLALTGYPPWHSRSQHLALREGGHPEGKEHGGTPSKGFHIPTLRIARVQTSRPCRTAAPADPALPDHDARTIRSLITARRFTCAATSERLLWRKKKERTHAGASDNNLSKSFQAPKKREPNAEWVLSNIHQTHNR